MLSELSELQESDENVWECPEVSFTLETRLKESGDVVQRRYTFSRAPEWEKWMFSEFEERRARASSNPRRRDWRRTRHAMWHENEPRGVEIPQEVQQQLEELLELDEMRIQTP